MDPVTGAMIGAGASGLLGFGGQMISNAQEQRQFNRSMEFNEAQANLNREFNSAEAFKQRDWEERMSNTSWRRAVHDMEAAGINPMLAFMKGGASTPSGSAASGSAAQAPQKANYGNLGAAMMNSASQGMAVAGQAAKLGAELDAITAGATKDRSSAAKDEADAFATLAANTRSEKQFVSLLEKLREDIKLTALQSSHSAKDLELKNSYGEAQAIGDVAQKFTNSASSILELIPKFNPRLPTLPGVPKTRIPGLGR